MDVIANRGHLVLPLALPAILHSHLKVKSGVPIIELYDARTCDN